MPLSSDERKTYRVYALVDPTNGVPYYVGQTANTLANRRQDHVRKSGNTRKGTWVRGLLSNHLEPQIVLLEELTGHRRDAYEREAYWIRKLRDEGQPLLN
ncbi:GIY-YIG nuclease family protein [Curtobacterium sp. MMLR14_010]|uniref:GIY-YIG nuclease family protein n=1 Tax=Curtobacterium sp. MMLR14_010 TaxID=1898743 RepID=UPI0009F5468D